MTDPEVVVASLVGHRIVSAVWDEAEETIEITLDDGRVIVIATSEWLTVFEKGKGRGYQ